MPPSIYAFGMGCDVKHAPQRIYIDGVNQDNLGAAVRGMSVRPPMILANSIRSA